SNNESVVVLSFRARQLQGIADLQDELLRISPVMEHKQNITKDDKRAVDAAMLTFVYCYPAQAVRNYETLSHNAASTIPPNAILIGSLHVFDPPSAHKPNSKRRLVPTTHDSLGVVSRIMKDDIIRNATGPVGFREIDQAGRIRRVQKKAFTARLVFALMIGVSLIGPILIMTLHESTSASLCTVSVATFIFALVMALFATEVDGKDVLAATAA
ncbi:hypothetical protein M441DRAFT_453525, partial [Trichoderma asperellum CBS 433.97]